MSDLSQNFRIARAAGRIVRCASPSSSKGRTLPNRWPARLARFAQALRLGLLLALMCLPAWAVAQARLSDPTAPMHRTGAGGTTSAPFWALQSTLIGPQRRVAVINGTVVSEGAVIDGATVVAIDYAAVLLEVGGRRLHLRLFGAEPVSKASRGNP